MVAWTVWGLACPWAVEGGLLREVGEEGVMCTRDKQRAPVREGMGRARSCVCVLPEGQSPGCGPVAGAPQASTTLLSPFILPTEMFLTVPQNESVGRPHNPRESACHKPPGASLHPEPSLQIRGPPPLP